MQWLAPKGITTLDLEPAFFSGVRTPALNDYASRRPSCLLESIERLYQSSFIFYTGPQSHYTEKAGSKGTGMASKVARQEYTLRKIYGRGNERGGKGATKEGTSVSSSPLPLPLQTFFCFRSNFRPITRLETLATQATRS